MLQPREKLIEFVRQYPHLVFLVFAGACSGEPRRELPSLEILEVTSGAPEPWSLRPWALNAIGDVDGDGIKDLAASYPYTDYTKRCLPAQVILASGVDGTVLLTIEAKHGRASSEGFGHFVASIGDLDLDGVNDLAISSPFGAEWTGMVEFYSSVDGALLASINGECDGFGLRLCGLHDIDGHGLPDIAIGCAQHRNAHLYSTEAQSLIDALIGLPLGRILDVNKDSVDDVVFSPYLRLGPPYAGLREFHGRWLARVHSGESFEPLASIEFGERDRMYPIRMGVIGDVDCDGALDIAVAMALVDERGVRFPAELRVYSSYSGKEISSAFLHLKGIADVSRIAECDDYNQDGVPDIMVVVERDASLMVEFDYAVVDPLTGAVLGALDSGGKSNGSLFWFRLDRPGEADGTFVSVSRSGDLSFSSCVYEMQNSEH